MNWLNKKITLLLMFSFLICGFAFATIEKDTIKTKTSDTEQDIKPGDSSGDAGTTPDKSINQKNPAGYDNFIDHNNNGIDDRAEKKTENRKKDNSQIQTPDLNQFQQSPNDSTVNSINR
ncbi:MAG: hypothetical protein GY865_15095 [candidate division Zixibacteria bacterium]|nr:hypothetical protein [candidate division Zixibacteria bacterium]